MLITITYWRECARCMGGRKEPMLPARQIALYDRPMGAPPCTGCKGIGQVPNTSLPRNTWHIPI
jgi:hypothetical protein